MSPLIPIIKNRITWLDIIKPNQEDFEFLKREFNFHPIILEELQKPSARPKVEHYNDYLFLVYHFTIYDPLKRTSVEAEVDFLATKDYLITVRYEENLEPINKIIEKIKTDDLFKKKILENTPGHLIYYILDETIEFSLRQLVHIKEKLCDIEEEIFAGREAKMLKEIACLKRDILDYRGITKPQKLIIQSLVRVGTEFFGQNIKIYFADLEGEFLKLEYLMDNFKETIESLENTNAQLLEAKTNKVMERFTILAFLTFPLMILAQILSINAQDNPLLEHPYGFWIMAVIIILVMGVMFTFFKKKGWL